MTAKGSPNFAFLAYHDARLVALGTQAEEHFAADPTVTLFKLRQFGEVLAQRAAAKVGLFVAEEGQQQLIDRLWERNVIGAEQRSVFHHLRRAGNAAVHEGRGDHSQALHQLRMAHQLGIWFQRSFGNDRRFAPGPFVPPAGPKHGDAALDERLKALRDEVAARKRELEEAQKAIEEARKAAEAEAAARLSAQELAAKAREEAAIWEALASEQLDAHRAQRAELDAQNQKLMAELAAQQAQAKAMPAQQLTLAIEQAAEASEEIEVDEAATRKRIDQQLRDAGWEVDSERLTFERGVRPTKGRNLAIAEWPTQLRGEDGFADYVLFAGLTVVAVVDALLEEPGLRGALDAMSRNSTLDLGSADHDPVSASIRSSRPTGKRRYVATSIGTPTSSATDVQMSVSTPGVSIDTTSAYLAPRSLRSRFGWSFHQPLTGYTPITPRSARSAAVSSRMSE